MSDLIHLELFSALANEFRRRVRKKFWKLSAPFSDEELESLALSHLYEVWAQKWDTVRPFENFARTSAFLDFKKELKTIRGKIPPSGPIEHPDSLDLDEVEIMYPPRPPVRSHKEINETAKAEELLDILKGTRRKERIVLAKRRWFMELGFGKEQKEGIHHRLDCDLLQDIAGIVQRSEVKWHMILVRCHSLMKHGRARISDDWIDRLPALI
jgi:hypothetical protein